MTARTVYLGNHQAVEVLHVEDGDGKIVGETRTPVDGKLCHVFTVPAEMPFLEAVTNMIGAWRYHSDGQPMWVASTDPAIAAALSEHYGCPIREPEPETEVGDAD